MKLLTPFQLGPLPGSDMGAGLTQGFPLSSAAFSGFAPKRRPLANSATERRSSALSSEPCACILPLVRALRIASGEYMCSISRGTACPRLLPA